MIKAEWYVDWFNSPYYHLLYNNRNEDEANLFIDNLCNKLELKTNTKIWDLACGKGRHAIFVNSLGYDTTGVDLSENSVKHAKEFENETLRFFRHDMRDELDQLNFDVVLNLFTSFGYFEKDSDNFKVIQTIKSSLKQNGIGSVQSVYVTDEKGKFLKSIAIDDLIVEKTDQTEFTARVATILVEENIDFDNAMNMVFDSKVKRISLLTSPTVYIGERSLSAIFCSMSICFSLITKPILS